MVNNIIKEEVLAKVTPEKQMIEIVFDHETYKSGFKFRGNSNEIIDAKSFVDGKRNIEYKPKNVSNEVDKGLLVLPSDIEDYGDINSLKNEIADFIIHYVDISQSFLDLCSRYAMMSWMFDAYPKIPYLRAIGDYGTGKTQFLSVMGSICYHAFDLGAGVTEATIFRTIDKYNGTLIIDEGNFQNTKKSSILTQILNKGYGRGGSVPRCNSKTNEPEYYSVFGPKIIGANMTYDDPALESRFLTFTMSETERDDIPGYLPEWHDWNEALSLRNKLLKYRLDNFFKVKEFIQKATLSGIEGFSKRTQEIITPLMFSLYETEIPEIVLNYLEQDKQEKLAKLQSGEEFEIALAIINSYEQGKRYIYPKEIKEMLPTLSITYHEIGDCFRLNGLNDWKRMHGGNRYVITEQSINRIRKKYDLQ